MITLAAFDIAGTTVEEHQAVYRALTDAAEYAGATVSDEQIRAWMGADKRSALRALLTREDVTPSNNQLESAFTDFRRRLFDAYEQTPPTPIPGVEQAFVELRNRGVRVALTTGFDRAVTDVVLAAVGWDDHVVDAVITTEDVAGGRPAPYMIFRAMEATMTTDVRDVIVAGDTTLDLYAGTAAGARHVVGVLTGGHDRPTLDAAPHTAILDSVAEIPTHLDRTT